MRCCGIDEIEANVLKKDVDKLDIGSFRNAWV